MYKNTFIKLFDCEETDYLIKHHPNSFLILFLIASNIIQRSECPEYFEENEAYITNYKKSGIKKYDQFLEALDVLIIRGYIQNIKTYDSSKKFPRSAPGDHVKFRIKLLKCNVIAISSEFDLLEDYV